MALAQYSSLYLVLDIKKCIIYVIPNLPILISAFKLFICKVLNLSSAELLWLSVSLNCCFNDSNCIIFILDSADVTSSICLISECSSFNLPAARLAKLVFSWNLAFISFMITKISVVRMLSYIYIYT